MRLVNKDEVIQSINRQFASVIPPFAGRGEDCRNVETLRQFIEALHLDQFEEMEAFFAEDVVHEIRSDLPSPFLGKIEGSAAVCAQLRKNFSAITEQRPEIKQIQVRSNTIILDLRETGRFVETGQAYDVRAIQTYNFANGVIITFVQDIIEANFL